MLNDKIALVTGATRGIGRAIALELGRQGATVIGTATSEAGAGQISAYLAEAGIKGRGVVLNVTDNAQTDAVLAEVAKEFGAITVLVNNAGITRDNL
ncbi:SDR family NAD(P)-dependent oxidoreductase, partial [Azonexus hydrophilus]